MIFSFMQIILDLFLFSVNQKSLLGLNSNTQEFDKETP